MRRWRHALGYRGRKSQWDTHHRRRHWSLFLRRVTTARSRGLRLDPGYPAPSPETELLSRRPLVISTGESWAFGPPKAMKNGSCSATTVAGSAALPFVISTG